MASFQIHQDDADKENPQHVMSKEIHIGQKHSFVGGSSAVVKQPLSVIGGIGNCNVPRILAGGGKMAFRDVGNVQKQEGNGNIKDAAAEAKKSVVPVVEQFKTFSVYEDNTEKVVKITTAKTATTNIVIRPENSTAHNDPSNGKENSLEGYQEQTIKRSNNDNLHKDFSLSQDDYVLDTTPMSVSDVLSPMSVDRSQLSLSTVEIVSEEKSDKSKADFFKDEIPRNDRQRFFEVVEYQQSILEYFRESEKKHRPKPHYMRRQTDINHTMRTILVDWLVEVSEEYNLDTETLYLSVSYIDRFLSHMSVVRNKLQLVGTAAMYIASKYEEIYPPDVGEFVFITDDTYTRTQVLRMEQIILKILAFDLCTPTAYVFINTYAVICDIPDKVKYLTMYISELSLLDADPYLRFYPSIISSASVALANHILGNRIWSSDLEEATSYHLEDLKEVILCLNKTHCAARELSQQAIQDKYKSDRYKRVSLIEPVELTESQLDEIIRDYKDYVNKMQHEKEQQQLRCKENSIIGTTPKGNLLLFNF